MSTTPSAVPCTPYRGVRLTVVDAPPFRREQAAEEFRRAILAGADAVIVNHVSNVFGCVQPLEEIAGVCRSRGVPLLVDASQSAGTLPLHLTELGAAFIAMPGHKGLYGPQGTGLLLCGERPARPLLLGGTGSASRDRQMPPTLPDRLEAGTHNMPGIAGLLEGLRFVRRRTPEAIACRERQLAAEAVRRLKALPGVEVFTPANGPPSHRCGVLPGGGPGLRRTGGGAGTPGYRPAGGASLCAAGPPHGGDTGHRHGAPEPFRLQHSGANRKAGAGAAPAFS